MELMDAIEKRRTVRDFSDKKVPSEIVEKALYAGLKAPSFNHQKQVYFTLVKDQDIRLALTVAGEMVEEVSLPFQEKLQKEYETLAREMYMDAIPKQKKMIMTAPEVLVVSYKPKTQIEKSSTVSDLNCLAAVWCCIENILLSLAEDDVFATTVVPDNTPEIKRILNMPQDLEVAVLIPLGYKAADAKIIPQKELSVDSVLHIDRWQ